MAEVRSKLLLEINASVGEATKALKQVERELNKLTKTQEEMGRVSERAGNQFGGGIAQIAVGVGVANLATAAFFRLGRSLKDLIVGSVQTANAVQRIQATLPVLAANTGRTTEEINRIIFAIREENKSIREATEVTRGIIIAGLDELDALRLIKVARDVGATAGISSANVNRIVLDSILTLNPGLLKQAGIAISLRVAFSTYADQLGITVTELTTAQKQTAVFNEVMKEGAKFAGAYEAAMTTTEKILRSVSDASEDVRFVIGELLNDAMLSIAETALEAVREFRRWAITSENVLNPQLKALARTVGVAVLTAFTLLNIAVRAAINFFTKWFAVLKDTGIVKGLQIALGALAFAISFVVVTLVNAANVIAENEILLAALTGAVIGLTAAFIALNVSALLPIIITIGPFVVAILGIALAITAVTKVTDIFVRDARAGWALIVGSIVTGAIIIVRALEAMERVFQFLGLTAGGSFKQVREGLEGIRDEIQQPLVDLLVKDTDLLNDSLFSTTDLLGGVRDKINEAVDAFSTDLTPSIQEVTEALENNTKGIKDWAKEQARKLNVVVGLWDEFIRVIEEFDISSRMGFDNFVGFLQNTTLDIDTFAKTFRKNFATIQRSLDETVSQQEDKLQELESAFAQTQDSITSLIASNVAEQSRIQISAQDDIVSAVLKADQSVASLRTKIDERRADAAERVATEQARVDDAVATERGRIAILRGRIDETIGKKKQELLQTLADREEALANFTAAGAEKVAALRSKELAQVSEIEQELIKRQTILKRVAGLEQGIIDSINTAREDAKLNEIDRILLVAQRKQLAIDTEFRAEQEQLNSKLAFIKTEQIAALAQLATIQDQRKIVEEFITDLLKENLAIRRAALDEDFDNQFALIDRATIKWQNFLSLVTRAINVAGGGALGGPRGFAPATANGGIVTSPQIRLVGEAGPEAIIPLRRGGGGFGNITINITGNTILGADKEKLAQQIGDTIFRRLNLNIRTG